MPGLDNIIPRRHVGNLKLPRCPGNCKVGIVDNSYVGVHPTMNVAFYRNHDFLPGKFTHQWRVTRALAMVPLAVDLGKGMNIMGDRIGVLNPKSLSDLKTDNT